MITTNNTVSFFTTFPLRTMTRNMNISYFYMTITAARLWVICIKHMKLACNENVCFYVWMFNACFGFQNTERIYTLCTKTTAYLRQNMEEGTKF
jgi:hypothetical protein